MNWQLNKIQYPIYNLGEGKRLGIWVQGCTLGCKGCVNPSIWDKKGGESISVIDLFNWIISLDINFDGITISGGEPFQQYEQMITFLHLIKTRTKMSVHCFTGYYLYELDKLYPDKLFYKYIDYLVDGRYIEKLQDNNNIKGSINQTIYKFTDGAPIKQRFNNNNNNNKWSLTIDNINTIYMSGIPKKDELKIIANNLKGKGFNLIFK